MEPTNAWDRAQQAIARAQQRNGTVVTPDNAESPFVASRTQMIPTPLNPDGSMSTQGHRGRPAPAHRPWIRPTVGKFWMPAKPSDFSSSRNFSPGNQTLPLGLVRFASTYNTDYRLVFSGTVITFLPVIILYILTQRRFTEGLTQGALKG